MHILTHLLPTCVSISIHLALPPPILSPPAHPFKRPASGGDKPCTGVAGTPPDDRFLPKDALKMALTAGDRPTHARCLGILGDIQRQCLDVQVRSRLGGGGLYRFDFFLVGEERKKDG